MSLLIYFSVFAVLIGSTAAELGIIGLPLPASTITTSIIGLAGMKAVLIALFFQHLKDEPKALSSLLLVGLIAATIFISISLLQLQHLPHRR